MQQTPGPQFSGRRKGLEADAALKLVSIGAVTRHGGGTGTVSRELDRLHRETLTVFVT